MMQGIFPPFCICWIWSRFTANGEPPTAAFESLSNIPMFTIGQVAPPEKQSSKSLSVIL
jgi:hypothetical protein